jgi:hypothetical protein
LEESGDLGFQKTMQIAKDLYKNNR